MDFIFSLEEQNAQTAPPYADQRTIIIIILAQVGLKRLLTLKLISDTGYVQCAVKVGH